MGSNENIDIASDDSVMIIKRTDVDILKQETSKLRQNLSKVLNHNVLQQITNFNKLQKELQQLQNKMQQKCMEVNHWKSRFEKLQVDCQKEKQEKLSLQSQLIEVSEQLNLQSDYFASMGSAYCTALWRVSQDEKAVVSMLSGPKACDLFTFVSHTLNSYIETYKDDMPDEESTEARFVCSLCGIITNIAASAFGRDVLAEMTEGIETIDTIISILIQAPIKGSSKMKNVILMSLYNLTINKKGLKYISSKPEIIAALVILMKEESFAELQLHSLLLTQSLITEQENPILLQQAKKLLTTNVLEKLCRSQNDDVKNVAMEIKHDILLFNNEP